MRAGRRGTGILRAPGRLGKFAGDVEIALRRRASRRRQVTVPVTRLPAPAGIGQDGLVPVVPPKLRSGSSVRVIAPSRSLAIIGPEVRAEADRKLAALGLTVSFGERVSGLRRG